MIMKQLLLVVRNHISTNTNTARKQKKKTRIKPINVLAVFLRTHLLKTPISIVIKTLMALGASMKMRVWHILLMRTVPK